MAKERYPLKPDDGLRKFQLQNCIGCHYVDKEKVGSGLPCCTYGFKLQVSGGKCETRKTKAEIDAFFVSLKERK